MLIEVEKLREDFKSRGSSYLDDLDRGAPEEVAALVSYLASKEARFVTGKPSTVSMVPSLHLS